MKDLTRAAVNLGIFNPYIPYDNPFFPSLEQFPFGRTSSPSNKNISLKSVSVTGDITGLLFSSTIRQEYKNETGTALEITYTFPLGFGTALLGMEARIGDKHLKGQVVEKAEAETRYGKAIRKGNSAIMVRESSSGLYTAKLGNIRPDETVTVDIHCAKLLVYEQGQVRICIPTVIGERYGNEHCKGGLAPDETAKVDVNARYPFSLAIELHGDIARADISSPSHAITTKKTDNGLGVSLAKDAFLDRDFILLLKNISENFNALCIRDDNLWLASASFIPEMPVMEHAPLAVKILVDCSGSMRRGSIWQARKGLEQVLLQLRPQDYVSYSIFGSVTKHLSQTLLPCSSKNIIKLCKAIKATEADMFETEMEAALKSTFAIRQVEGQELQPIILLITDGDVWDVESIVASAKKSGHRIFVIGVGSAPAESLLRNLAEQTGGACELVAPEEDIAETIVRMFHRMRGNIASNIKFEWGQKPLWQSNLPKFIYDGDTVHAFALLQEEPKSGPVLSWEFNGQKCQTKADRIEETDNRDLLRLGRKCQIEQTCSKKGKIVLALKYGLVSKYTSLVLVHERADADKINGKPVIQQVPQMPAHGHGCYLFTGGECFAPFTFDEWGIDEWEIPRFELIYPWGRRRSLKKIMKPMNLTHMYEIEPDSSDTDIEDKLINSMLAREALKTWKENLQQLASIDEFMAKIQSIPFLKTLVTFLNGLAGYGIGRQDVWCAFICWLLEGVDGSVDPASLILLKSSYIREKNKNELVNAFIAWTGESF